MEIITREIVNELSKATGQALVSIYMPTHRLGREMQQDPIRFRNLLSEAEERLAERSFRRPDIEALLKPAHMLKLATGFWMQQSDGLAIFITPDFMKYFRLPIRFEKLLVIANRLHLKPLLPLLSRNGHFYVLALSQKQVRLLEGSLFSVDEINLEGVPTSLRQALWFDDPERQLQYHTGTAAPGAPGMRPSVFHGHGAGSDDDKSELLRYFQQVDRGLMELLGDEQAPLVLAGVDYLLPIYREANHYPYIVEGSIQGNPDETSAADLHREAWELVEPIFRTGQRQALARYRELRGSGSGLADNRVETIVPAAHYGRVDTLFVTLDRQIWGSFDASKNSLEQHEAFQAGDQDLLDLAAMQTLYHGGAVFALKPDRMPDETPLAAILRYA
ncbi:MAG: hypothetical protein AB1894_24680 [Chloroflexota bacterium]